VNVEPRGSDLNNSLYHDTSDETVAETRSILHRVIVDVRYMTKEERAAEGVADRRVVIVLDDGTVLFAGVYGYQGKILGLARRETEGTPVYDRIEVTHHK
jgi:hypothetical protein